MITYQLATMFIAPLIYDDYSGLEDGDHIMLEDFLNDVDGSYWTVDDTEQHDNFNRCEVTRLMANTTTFTLHQ